LAPPQTGGGAAKQISATSQELVRTMGEVSHSSGETADMAATAVRISPDGRHHARPHPRHPGLCRQAGRDERARPGISAVVDTISKVADPDQPALAERGHRGEKAGEFGLGFSVVAREIRRLPTRLPWPRWTSTPGNPMQDSVTTGVQEMGRLVARK
jgi:methyl-accepting chemotaxis protein WspA